MAGLFDIFSNDNAEQAAAQRKAGLQQGYDALSGMYGQGRDAITTNYGNAGDLYKNLLKGYEGGSTAYGDAVGANGPEGFSRAVSNFKTDPGYGFSMDQGLQALQRTHAAAGNLNSGNADADTLKFSQGLADQSYGSYVQRLLPYFSGTQAATAGAAGVATGQGIALNTSFQGQGGAANANYTGQGAADAAATMNNYNVSSNMWNGIGAAVKAGSSLFGAFG